jgi:hypothetical protein
MKLNLSPWHYEELIKKSYSLDHIFLLKLIHENYDVTNLVEDSLKISAIHQGLIRKGLITDNGALTTIGVELLVFLDTKEQTKLVKKKSTTSDFEEWYKTFPGTDTFTHKGKTFTGSRNLRQNPADCRIKFDKILIEGEYTVKELIEALKFDVLQKKEASVQENTNKLKYMQNSLTYLNQRSYEPYIELIKEGIQIKETQSNGTDI